ncbi:MAG: hypothetical protein U0R64_03190 [Candidatus Nanopelagicales bacterium]
MLREQLDLVTDYAGIGRLYEASFADHVCYSNRPAAAAIFAGPSPSPAVNGWRTLVACDWTMGRSTAFAGVRALPAGRHVRLTQHHERPIITDHDPAERWVGRRAQRRDFADLVEQGVAGLTSTMASVSALWPQEVEVDLSGGRDSRAVAAAALASGIPVRFHTHDLVPGELEMAARLLELVDRPVHHRIERIAHTGSGSASPAPGVFEQSVAWHRYAEGVRPSSYLWQSPPADLTGRAGLVVGGAGGELAHEIYYTDDDLRNIGADNLAEWASALLQRRVIARGAVGQVATKFTARRIEQVVRKGLDAGFDDATVLDYFFIGERLRRWGMTGEWDGIVSPLLTPGFVDAAFALTPSERTDNRLIDEILTRLMPRWVGLPFVHGQPARPPRVRHVGLATDHERVATLVNRPDEWQGLFSPRRIKSAWDASRQGASTATQELGLRRLVWWAAFRELVEPL